MEKNKEYVYFQALNKNGKRGRTVVNVNIRLMRLAEASILAKMVGKSPLGELYFQADEKKIQGLLENMKEEEVILVAEIEAEVVGFIWYDKIGAFRNCPYVHLHFVCASWQRKGIGKALLKAFEENVKEKMKSVFLAVAEFNYQAEELYTACGYREVGAIPSLYRKGVTENLLMKGYE